MKKRKEKPVGTVPSPRERFELWAGNLFVNETLALKDHDKIERIGWIEFMARDVARNFDSMRDFVREMFDKTDKLRDTRKILKAMLNAPDAEKFFELLARCLIGDLVQTRDAEDIATAKTIALQFLRKLTDSEAARELRKVEPGLSEETFRQRKSRLLRLREAQIKRLLPGSVTKKV
jgi:hypothetical protein